MDTDKKTEIYYFTGTGNSLAIAKDIAKRINGRLISIPSLINNENIVTNADVIGIIFPVYHATFGESGIPIIVRKFIRKLKDLGSKYMFAICTHSGMPGSTIGNLDKTIKSQGGELSAGFTVEMSIPHSGLDKIKYALFHRELKADIQKDNKKRQELFEHWDKKLNVIQKHINARRKVKLETPNKIVETILAPHYLFQKQTAKFRYRKLSNSIIKDFDKLTLLADRSFRLNERCNGCAICEKICPVKNIKMIEKKPVWQHRCENCYACFQWCPHDAIYGEIVEYEKKYHHTNVKVTDLFDKKV